MTRVPKLAALTVVSACVWPAATLHAAPYASNVVKSGTNVSFILNEPADTLHYRVNGGAWQTLDGSSKGTKAFSLGASTDVFDIRVSKNDAVGYRVPTGANIAATTNGLSQTTAEGGLRLISDDTNVLNKFNSPRGISISNNPNAPQFGTSYVVNSAAGSTTGVVRALGDGLYALRADQSDAFGYGNTAKNPGPQFD